MLNADQVLGKLKRYLEYHILLKHYVLEAADMLMLHVPAYLTELDQRTLKGRTDQLTNRVLFKANTHMTAYSTRGANREDDCFFSNVSLALYGVPAYSSLLRLKTLIYMAKNYDSLCLDYCEFMTITATPERTFRNCARASGASNALTVAACARALGIVIESVCPSLNGTSQCKWYRLLNRQFLPDEHRLPPRPLQSRLTKITLCWTGGCEVWKATVAPCDGTVEWKRGNWQEESTRWKPDRFAILLMTPRSQVYKKAPTGDATDNTTAVRCDSTRSSTRAMM